MEYKKVELNLGLVCNNFCKFCMNGEPFKKRRFVSFKIIEKELYEFYEKGFRAVGFLGGEPTIYPNLIDTIASASRIGYLGIHLVSNGRRYADKDFLEQLVKVGVTRFYVSIHSHKPDIEDYLTSVKGSFREKIQGISNLVSLKNKGFIKDNILLNTVINKFNFKYLPEIIFYYSKNFGLTNFRFNFIRPSGRAFQNFNLMVPRYLETKIYLVKAINLAKELNVKITTEAIPFCLMGKIENFQEFVGEFKDGQRRARFGTHVREDFLIEQRRKDELKIKNKSCQECIYNYSCEGPWRNYVKVYSFKEFKPVIKLALDR